jgi:hypothetical protein
MTYADLTAPDPSPCATFPTYIDTANPQKSFIWAKLEPTSDLTGCGTLMPRPAAVGNETLADLVLQWIQGGAQPLVERSLVA